MFFSASLLNWEGREHLKETLLFLGSKYFHTFKWSFTDFSSLQKNPKKLFHYDFEFHSGLIRNFATKSVLKTFFGLSKPRDCDIINIHQSLKIFFWIQYLDDSISQTYLLSCTSVSSYSQPGLGFLVIVYFLWWCWTQEWGKTIVHHERCSLTRKPNLYRKYETPKLRTPVKHHESTFFFFLQSILQKKPTFWPAAIICYIIQGMQFWTGQNLDLSILAIIYVWSFYGKREVGLSCFLKTSNEDVL